MYTEFQKIKICKKVITYGIEKQEVDNETDHVKKVSWSLKR